MKLTIFFGIFLYIFPLINNQKNLYFQHCNYNYYSKKNKIANEIDLLNIISLINNKNFKIYYKFNYITQFPVSKKSNDIFALLTEKERYFFSLILTKCKKYLEFGMGGSTLLAYMTSNIKKIISVESDINWINKMRKFKNIKNEEGKRIFLEYINIGKILNNGYPYNMAKNEDFFKYSKQIFKKYKNDYDLVFIDGRFRVACVLQVILNCKINIKILIHDFNNRPYYHILYKYLDMIYSIDTLALFSIKEDIDLEEVNKDYNIYKNNPK
jgi:hypothetical protein